MFATGPNLKGAPFACGCASVADVRIRPAERSDLSAIATILNFEIRSGTASWTETPKTADDMTRWFDRRRADGCPVLVAAADRGAVVGYASYGPFRSGEGYRLTVEHTVYVTPALRRRGIARSLMERLIAEAQAAGLHRMIGGVSTDQPASLALHRSLGFEEQGRLNEVGRKAGRWLDLSLMVLTLDRDARTPGRPELRYNRANAPP